MIETWLCLMRKLPRSLPATREKRTPQTSLVTLVMVGTWLFFKAETTTEAPEQGGEGSVTGIPSNMDYEFG